METTYSKRDESTSFLDSFPDDFLEDDNDRGASKLIAEAQHQQMQPEADNLNLNEANSAKNDEVEFSEKRIENDAIAMETREDGEEEAETPLPQSETVAAVAATDTEIAMEIDADASKANKSNAENAVELEHAIAKDDEHDVTTSAKESFENEISESQTNIVAEIEERAIQAQSAAGANVNEHQSGAQTDEAPASEAIIERTDSGGDDNVEPMEEVITTPEPEQHQNGGGNANKNAKNDECYVTTSGADSEQQSSVKSETPRRYNI